MNAEIWLNLPGRIGWTLLHSVWQFAAVGLGLLFVLRVLRGRPAWHRYLAQCCAMLLIVLSAVITLCVVDTPSPRADLTATENRGAASSARLLVDVDEMNTVEIARLETETSIANIESAKMPGRVGSPIVVGQAMSKSTKPTEHMSLWGTAIAHAVEPWLSELCLLWFVGLLFVSLRPVVAWQNAFRARRTGITSVNDQITRYTATMAKRVGVNRAVRVVESSLVEVPTVLGWLRPLILLPASAITGLSPEQLQAVIAHELAHVRRHDHLVNAFQLLAETVFFYHPVVWWISHQMRIERELCCDDAAIGWTGDRAGYAKLLLWLEEHRAKTRPNIAAMSASGGPLLDRVRHITLHEPTSNPTSGIAVAALAAAILVGGTVVANALTSQRSNAAPPVQESTEEISNADGNTSDDDSPFDESDQQRSDSLAKLSGRIFGPDGKVSRVEGQLRYKSTNDGTTNGGNVDHDGGRFGVDVPAGEIVLTFFPAERFAPAWTETLRLNSGGVREDVDIRLREGSDATVQVRNDSGDPVAGATVVALPEIDGSVGGPIVEHSTDSDGKLTLQHLADTRYGVRVSKPGYESLRSEPTQLYADEVTELKLSRARPATGTVLDSDGKPVAGARIRGLYESSPTGGSQWFADSGSGFFGTALAETDSDGSFVLDALRSDSKYLCLIECPNQSRVLCRDIVAGLHDVSISLPRRMDLRIRVTGDLDQLPQRRGKPFVVVRQSVRMKTSDGGTVSDLVGEDVPIETVQAGVGEAVYRGLVVDQDSADAISKVRISLGYEQQWSKTIDVSTSKGRTIHDVEFALAEGTGADTESNDVNAIEGRSPLAPPSDSAAQQLGETIHVQMTAIDRLKSFQVDSQSFTSYYGNAEGIIGLKDERALEHLRSALDKRDFDRSRSTADLTWAWKSDEVVSKWRQKYIYEEKAYDQRSSRTWNGKRGWYRDSTDSLGRYRTFADTFKNHYFAPSQFLHLGDHRFAWADTDEYTPFFVGSTIPVSHANYQSLPDEEFAGETCHVIRSVPRQEQYWISKRTGRLRGCLSFVSQGRFTWMHELPVVTELAGREFASRDEFQQWYDSEPTVEQRLRIQCDFWYMHEDNQHPKDLIEFSDYSEVADGIEIPMTEWSSTWMHAGEQYKYNVSHLVVRRAGPADDLQALIEAALPKEGDKVNDWRHPVHVSYRWSDEIDEQGILTMVDAALEERRKNQDQYDRIMKPLRDMVGREAPKLTEEGWVGEFKRPEGGKMLLHFWATWCGPCKNDIPLLNKMAKNGWNIVGIHAPGTSSEDVKDAVKENEINYPVVIGPEKQGVGIQPNTIAGYPIQVYPVSVLIDASGTIEAVGQLSDILKR